MSNQIEKCAAIHKFNIQQNVQCHNHYLHKRIPNECRDRWLRNFNKCTFKFKFKNVYPRIYTSNKTSIDNILNEICGENGRTLRASFLPQRTPTPTPLQSPDSCVVSLLVSNYTRYALNKSQRESSVVIYTTYSFVYYCLLYCFMLMVLLKYVSVM